MAPTKQRAVIVTEDGWVKLSDSVDVPKPGPGEILVKIIAAAQNPTDWKTAVNFKRAGSVSGCDYSGIVEEIGPNVPESVRKIGERVAGFVHGGVGPSGSFSEYLVAPAEFVVHIPDNWSFEDAAQLGIAPFTAVQTLWASQNLPTPNGPAVEKTYLLVSGGSSSVGQYVIQLAKISGIYVIATASPKNFDLVKTLGADEVFDYKDPEASKKIKAATGNKLYHAVDTISEHQTPSQIAEALSDDGGVVSIILKYESPKPGVKVIHSIAYSLLGEFVPENMVELELKRGREYAKFLTDLLATGRIKPNPTHILPYGLASVPEGLQFMKDGKVSAQKLTYRIADTPA